MQRLWEGTDHKFNHPHDSELWLEDVLWILQSDKGT